MSETPGRTTSGGPAAPSRRRVLRPRAFAAALCGAALMLALSPVRVRAVPQEVGRRGGTIRVKAFSPTFNPVFDPASRGIHYFVSEQIFDGLVRFDAEFNILPSLAEYWEISEDGRRFTFYLRHGVRFHDGVEVTAEDVKYSLERLVRPVPGNILYLTFVDKVIGAREFFEGRAPDVAGFLATDRYTFDILWERPYVSGLYVLGMYYCKVLPAKRLKDEGDGFFEHPVGTGAFRFSSWLRSPRLDIMGVCLERNPDYFGRKAWVDELEYSPFFTADQFREGDVHMIPVVSEDFVRGRYVILENASPRLVFLAMSGDKPPFDKVEVRRAVAAALDKGRLAQAMSTPATTCRVTDNYIPSILPGFYPRDAAPPADAAESRRRLSAAGALPADGDVRVDYCFLLPRSDEQLRFARELARELAPLGLRVEARGIRDWSELLAARGPFLAALDWTLDFPDAENIIAPLFASNAVNNGVFFRYRNPRLDQLLEQSEVESSMSRRLGLFRQMEDQLRRDVPAVPLFGPTLRLALQPNVRGARIPALGFYFMRMEDVWLDR